MDLIHLNLRVSDVERSIEFYTQEFDFVQTWGFDSSDGNTKHRYVSADNGIELQLTETTELTELDHGNSFDHIALAVDNVDTFFASMNHHGVINEPSDQPAAGARTAFVLDPDGHKIELVQSLTE